MADVPGCSSSVRLLAIARARFPDIDQYPVEVELLRACGEIVKRGGENPRPYKSESDNAKVDGWEVPERMVRADIIKWLCSDFDARNLVDQKGIRLQGVRIQGALQLTNLQIPFPLSLVQCWMDSIDLSGSSIPTVNLYASWANRFVANYTKVAQALGMTEFRAHTGATARGARVGDLYWSGGSIGRYGFFASYLTVEQDLNLDALSGSTPVPFRVNGSVVLDGAVIGGNVSFVGGKFNSDRGAAISLVNATIKGRLSFSTAPGSAGNAEYFEANTWLDLRLASVGTFEDDNIAQDKHWILEGFVYDRLHLSESMFVQTTAPAYLASAGFGLLWLSKDGSGSVQPYHQLAKFLDGIGDQRGAVQVRVAMEELLSQRNDGLPVRYLRKSIAYGYAPENAIYGLVAVTAIGWLLYWRSYRMGTMTPTERDASEQFGKARELPGHYPRFSPLVYSFENTFPLVKLGQVGKWQPKPDGAAAEGPPKWSVRGVRWFALLQAILGWVLAGLFAAAVAGIVQRR